MVFKRKKAGKEEPEAPEEIIDSGVIEASGEETAEESARFAVEKPHIEKEEPLPEGSDSNSSLVSAGAESLRETAKAELNSSSPKGLKAGLALSRKVLSRPFAKAAVKKAIDPSFWAEAEEALIAADAGVDCSAVIVQKAKEIVIEEGVKSLEGVREAFRKAVVETILSSGTPPSLEGPKPRVIFVVGVNGVGKTTTCAKIGYIFKSAGKRVIFAAADTFRAAGIEQMEMWAARVGAPVVRHKAGGDPAAVVYDCIERALAKDIDAVVVDTAGRLHTKKNLMEELSKIWRVAEKKLTHSPLGILVIDATTGQNGVNQARIFSQALKVDMIALTKMDGTAKGGVVLAIGKELKIPVGFVGVGEGLGDLRPFDPVEYAKALF